MSAIEKYRSCNETGTCSICQEDPKYGDLIWHLTVCGHIYHKSCILPWTERSTSCPTCRRSFERPPAEADQSLFQKILGYAFTVKIVNTLLISDYKRELPTIREIIAKYKVNGIKMDPADINTTNLNTFYESYEQLEMQMHMNYDAPKGLTMVPIIQALIRRQISYPRMYQLIVRCSPQPQ